MCAPGIRTVELPLEVPVALVAIGGDVYQPDAPGSPPPVAHLRLSPPPGCTLAPGLTYLLRFESAALAADSMRHPCYVGLAFISKYSKDSKDL